LRGRGKQGNIVIHAAFLSALCCENLPLHTQERSLTIGLPRRERVADHGLASEARSKGAARATRQTNASANPGIASLDPYYLPARHLDLSARLDALGTTVKGTSTAAD
jgi:hypothetical protein